MGIIYHNSGIDNDYLLTDKYDIHPNTLSGLELAKFVLIRLVEDQNVKRIAEKFGNDIQFINDIVEFLKDIKWIKQDQINGLYEMTEAGKMKSHASKMVLDITHVLS
jgi:hypothetical protein